MLKKLIVVVICYVLLGVSVSAETSEKDAFASYESGDFQNASQAFAELAQRAMRNNDKDAKASALHNQALALYKNGEYEKAARLFVRLLEEKKDLDFQAQVYGASANNKFRKGEQFFQKNPQKTLQTWEEALKDAKNGLELEPTNENARKNKEFIEKAIEELKEKLEQQQDQQKQDQQKQDQQKQDQQDQQKQDQQKQDQQKQDQQKQDQQDQQKQDQQDQQNKNESGEEESEQNKEQESQNNEQSSSEEEPTESGKSEPNPEDEGIEEGDVSASEEQEGEEKEEAVSAKTGDAEMREISREEAEYFLDAMRNEEAKRFFQPRDKLGKDRDYGDW